jgi:hypothetical protein
VNRSRDGTLLLRNALMIAASCLSPLLASIYRQLLMFNCEFGQACPVRWQERRIRWQERPVLRQERPVLRQERPVLRQERPVLRQERRVLRQERPVLRQERPVLRQERPVLRQECPVLRQECPGLGAMRGCGTPGPGEMRRPLEGLKTRNSGYLYGYPIKNAVQDGKKRG